MRGCQQKSGPWTRLFRNKSREKETNTHNEFKSMIVKAGKTPHIKRKEVNWVESAHARVNESFYYTFFITFWLFKMIIDSQILNSKTSLALAAMTHFIQMHEIMSQR